MKIKNCILLFVAFTANLCWAGSEQATLKALPNQTVTYNLDLDLTIQYNTLDKIVPVATAASETEFNLTLSTVGPMEEIVISPINYLFKSDLGPLSVQFDLKNPAAEHPFTELVKQHFLKTHLFPLTTDKNLLTSSSERYANLPLTDAKAEEYISFVEEVQKLMKFGHKFKVGVKTEKYDQCEHILTVHSISQQSVETTHELKWHNEKGDVGYGKFLVSHERQNILLSQITGEIKIILADNLLKCIPGYDSAGSIELIIKINLHSKS